MKRRANIDSLFDDAKRQLDICNACRYCEGYCPVFPALERRLSFSEGDIIYLANLCHDCKACYYACPYAPPHEFKVDVPTILKEIRTRSYRIFSWPAGSSILLDKQTSALLVLTALSTLLMLSPSLISDSSRLFTQSHFYQIIPRELLIVGGLATGVFVMAAFIAEFLGFWKRVHGRFRDLANLRAAVYALWEALGHRWFKDGGSGCMYPPKPLQFIKNEGSYTRIYHHAAIMSGFALTFVSTVLAYLYEDWLHIGPPYPIIGPVVLAGTAGGLLILGGGVAMIYFKARFEKNSTSLSLDRSFIVMIGLVSVTGLLTLQVRSSTFVGPAFVVHMGLVLSFLLMLPYSKFIHLIYRYAALVKNRIEEVKQ